MGITNNEMLMAAAAGNVQAGGVAAEGVSFDGVSDYLSRSSDLVGNADSKTFTFSCWVYGVGTAQTQTLRVLQENGAGNCIFRHEPSANTMYFDFENASGTRIRRFEGIYNLQNKTWNHVLVSLSITAASTENWHIYINDVDVSSVITKIVTYSGFDDIDFTKPTLSIAGPEYSQFFKGRLAHLYLDYTYRDLSIEANRRLFITKDLKPAPNQAALNPILYLPMRDADTAHINEGTGGDFTPNGVLDTAQRGPNQWNCVASEFDGVDDYLSKSAALGTNASSFTLSFTYNVSYSSSHSVLSSSGTFFEISQDGTGKNLILYIGDSLEVNIKLPITYNIYKNQHITISKSSGNFQFLLNGKDRTSECVVTSNSYVSVPFSNTNWRIFAKQNGMMTKGVIGEFYLDNSYIDLSQENPFWDSTANRPKPVRQVLEETGATPLIAMPISADDPGKNYGTGGDFALSGGPLTGARGGSEFWARSVVVDGINYLTNSGVLCASLVKWILVDGGATWSVNYLNNVIVSDIGNGTDNGVVAFYWGTSESINWSLEGNIIRVTDQLGYPKDIYKIVSDNPQTVLALPFDDPDNLGKNLGTGGDFTVVGTVTQGSDVDPYA
jgi:hypothetical protein